MCTNVQPMNGGDEPDIAQVMIKELEHVLSLVGPAKEEIAQLQEQIVGRQVPPSNTVLKDIAELKHQLVDTKEENTKLQQQLSRVKTNESKYSDMSDKLEKEKKKVRDLEASINALKDREAQRKEAHKEEKSAFIEVNHDLEMRLQAALKEVEKVKDVRQQCQLNLETNLKKLQQENAKLSASLRKEKTEKENLGKDLSDTKSRLSKLMGDKLSDNNPDIADLSDNNRPTKLAEKYQELYDNQWTDAYEIAEKHFPDLTEKIRIKVLLQILMNVHKFCKEEYTQQDRDFMQAMYRTDKGAESGFAFPTALKAQLKELKHYAATASTGNLTEKYLKNCDKTTKLGRFNEEVNGFTHECVTICWLMAHQDPPLVFERNEQREPGLMAVSINITQRLEQLSTLSFGQHSCFIKTDQFLARVLCSV
ncbi:uncharacterized protein LOC123556662 [Mercenaria mercenaria]|uniref:uncharacterized protein LOC123556662 n=1 Tax=Mercenaria mercenaria TaxID=6596 RepID=UPI00234E7C1E|nr:uncharacterized protein LOC123556662 [Mercenaria mercenaria]